MKPRSSSPIQLAFSCKEDYQQMPSCDGGKYCKVCNTIVLDLTNKTNPEILELIRQHGSVCGKVNRPQLQPSHQLNYRLQKIFTSVFIALGLSSLSKNIFAQDVKFKPENPDSMISFDGTEDNMGILVKNETPLIGIIIEKMPQYKYGGDEGLRKFLDDNLVYPKEERKNNIEGKVYVTFTIDEWGLVTHPKIARGVSEGIDQEVLRVIQLLEFTPGESGGHPTKVSYQLPIHFTLK